MSDQAGCRIIVISPTAARAHQFVERVQAISSTLREGNKVAASDKHAQTSISTNKDPLAAGSSTSIPWTIANKYYTAEVHFETHEFELFRVHHAIGVPAIIYVWGPGEPYREHVQDIAQKVQHYDPEVSLAVRFGGQVANAAEPSVDHDGLDEFLSMHGFEFIEGDRSYRRPTQDADRNSDDEDSGIPGLPRVIDALSTIMWPSIVHSEAAMKRKSRARDLMGWALEEEGDEGLRSLITSPPALASQQTKDTLEADTAQKGRMHHEMEELERWLDDEEISSGVKYSRGKAEGQPAKGEDDLSSGAVDEMAQRWVISVPVSSTEGWEDMMTPPAIREPQLYDSPHHDTSFEHGFEDDFADFVSASSRPHALSDDKLLEVHYDVGRLTPVHTGTSYRSLGSVSDFGGDENLGAEYRSLDGDQDDDPDLPSRAEVLETSRRLFGASAFVPASDPDLSNPVTSDTRPPPASADSSVDMTSHTETDDESFAAFDLSRVFSALQGMKDEIAGMENEDERRRAAARVALGLVYGLGAGGDRTEQGTPAGVGESGGGA